MGESAEEKEEAKPEQTKRVSELMKEMGIEMVVDEELQNSGGLCIIGAKMPKPKPTPPEDQPLP